jgi:hypothetical protein
MFNNCGKDIEGTFYFSDEARKYLIDTSITSIRFIDNFGISEEFYIDQKTWYKTHHYFDQWSDDGPAYETFGIAYHSTVNGFFFMFVLRADVESTDLEIEWNQIDKLVYNFESKTVDYGVKAKVNFIDTMTVRGVKYQNIIEIDYTENANEIDKDTPLKTYISANKGLIKFERKDKIILERIE